MLRRPELVAGIHEAAKLASARSRQLSKSATAWRIWTLAGRAVSARNGARSLSTRAPFWAILGDAAARLRCYSTSPSISPKRVCAPGRSRQSSYASRCRRTGAVRRWHARCRTPRRLPRNQRTGQIGVVHVEVEPGEHHVPLLNPARVLEHTVVDRPSDGGRGALARAEEYRPAGADRKCLEVLAHLVQHPATSVSPAVRSWFDTTAPSAHLRFHPPLFVSPDGEHWSSQSAASPASSAPPVRAAPDRAGRGVVSSPAAAGPRRNPGRLAGVLPVSASKGVDRDQEIDRRRTVGPPARRHRRRCRGGQDRAARRSRRC